MLCKSTLKDLANKIFVFACRSFNGPKMYWDSIFVCPDLDGPQMHPALNYLDQCAGPGCWTAGTRTVHTGEHICHPALYDTVPEGKEGYYTEITGQSPQSCYPGPVLLCRKWRSTVTENAKRSSPATPSSVSPDCIGSIYRGFPPVSPCLQ